MADYQVPTSDGQHIPVRVYRGTKANSDHRLPGYVFYHGGGFLFGSVTSEDAACARIAAEIPIAVLSVCYRHTPDFKYPTQHNDAWEAFEWIAARVDDLRIDGNKLLVGGISAGGGLACSVAVRHAVKSISSSPASKIVIRGQLLCIPWLIHRDGYPFDKFVSPDRNSYSQCGGAPVLPISQLNLFTDLLACSTPDDHLLMSPGNMSSEWVSRLPRTAFVVAGNDPVRDEGLMMATMLKSQARPTKVHIFSGLPHGFRRFEGLSSSGRWDQIVVESIQWMLTEDAAEQPWRVEEPPYSF